MLHHITLNHTLFNIDYFSYFLTTAENIIIEIIQSH